MMSDISPGCTVSVSALKGEKGLWETGSSTAGRRMLSETCMHKTDGKLFLFG